MTEYKGFKIGDVVRHVDCESLQLDPNHTWTIGLIEKSGLMIEIISVDEKDAVLIPEGENVFDFIQK